MTTTASDLVEATLDWLKVREQLNVLAATIDTVTTTLTFDYELSGVAPGALLCVDIEVMHVVAIDRTAGTATVLRQQRGSTAAAHTAGTAVQVNPRFSRWSVFRALNDDLADLSALGLYQMKTTTLTYNSAEIGYELDVTDAEQVYSVRYQVPGSHKDWPLLERHEWSCDLVADTDDFASGFALYLYRECYPGREVKVVYHAPYTPFTVLTDDAQTDAGLHPQANRLPPIGAAISLTAGHESGRIGYDTQPDTRRPEEVPVGSNVQTSEAWRRLRKQWIDAEMDRLARRYATIR